MSDRTAGIRKIAAKMWESDGDLEIDEDATVSPSAENNLGIHAEDDGFYVQAWVWVPGEDVTHTEKQS